MKRVLITGGAGFIAHHVILYLIKNTDWQILSLDRLDYSGNLNRLDYVISGFDKDEKSRVKIIFHDLKAQFNPWIEKEIGDVDIILHLAAGSHVDRSIEYPMEFVLDNVVGTANVLEYARKINDNKTLERFIYFSTDEIFGPAPNGINYRENDRYNSTNPYSATKAGGEELAVAYQNTYNLPIYITHTMNVFGERQHPEKFIPMSIKKIRDGNIVSVHSDKSKTVPGSRHYIHAKDVSEAILFLLNKEINHDVDYGGAKCPKFNIVGSEEIDNLELAKIIAKSQGKELNYEMVDFHTSRPGHDLRYSLSGEKMRKLGWQPSIKLSERIKQVVDWSIKNQKWIEI
ncbi:MAG: NAD-dependent epimerase [Flavobacteriaceae bacterium]|nr:NAD-dependent epimerase [Flavobacteriaceae bacterium]